jgi:stress response protein SCP2
VATSLSKNETYNLYSSDATGQPVGDPAFHTVRFGLRWEPVKAERKGLGGRAERKLREMQGLTDPADWDAGAIFFTDGDPKKYIGFGNLEPFKDEATVEERTSATHSGDSRRGDGDGDDEAVDLHLLRIPRRYNQIVFVGGAYKIGSEVNAVRDVKATLYSSSNGAFEVVGEYEPSLLGAKRMIAVACFTRVPGQDGLFDLNLVNQSFDCTPGNLPTLLRGAMNLSLPGTR